MNPDATPDSRARVAVAAAVAGRWLLGGCFLYTGLSKALHPVDFLKLLRQYELVRTDWLLNALAAALPWFEIFCAALLFAGVAVRGTSLVLAVMLAFFTWAVWQRALGIEAAQAIAFCAIKFDCGCGNGEVYICRKLPENAGLILLCLWMLRGRGRPLSLRYSLR